MPRCSSKSAIRTREQSANPDAREHLRPSRGKEGDRVFNIDPPTTMHETEQRIAWFRELCVEYGLPVRPAEAIRRFVTRISSTPFATLSWRYDASTPLPMNGLVR